MDHLVTGTNSADIMDRDTGRPRLLADQCATCIYRPGNLMHLRRGRLLEITNAARRNNSFITCHSTLPGMSGAQPAVCRGFFDRFSTNFLRIMGRLGGWHEVPAAQVTVRRD
jgi:hypothetical protein